MKIRVTAKHISKGSRFNTDACPIALALLDAGLPRLTVGTRQVIDYFGGKASFLSRSAQRFVSRFDRQGRKAVKPFTFILKESL